MKQSYLFFFFLFPYFLFSQTIQISDSTNRTEWLFSSQEQIDQFPKQYPGLTHLNGDVTIQGENIVNLDSLTQLNRIEGRLKIWQCDSLISVNGLSNLNQCGGLILKWLNRLDDYSAFALIDTLRLGLSIGYCDSLKTLTDFSDLKFTNSIQLSSIDISDFSGIEQLDSLPDGLNFFDLDSLLVSTNLKHLKYIGKELQLNGIGKIEDLDLNEMTFDGYRLDINFNDHLKSISMGVIPDTLMLINIGMNNSLKHFVFPGLKYVSSQFMLTYHDSLEYFSFPDLVYSEDIKIENNKQLLHFDFPSLKFSEQIYVNDNKSLLDLNGFQRTDSIHDAYIRSNRNLVDVSGISNLSAYTRNVSFVNNKNLPEIIGFNNIKNLSYVNISQNISLKKINGFNNVKNVVNDFKFEHNMLLTEFEAFERLDSIGGTLNIVNLDSMTVFPQFPNLKYIGEHLVIEDLESTPNVSGLSELNYVGGFIRFIDNNGLLNFDGLQNIRNAYQTIEFDNNKNQLNFIGLNGLREIEGDFYVHGNHSCTDFEGLGNLSVIRGDFNIRYSSDFESFQGLHKLRQVGQFMSISDNNKLRNFQGLKSLKYVGYFSIYNNTNLQDCSGLDSLYYVSSLKFVNNDSLKNLSGLNRINTVKYLVIEENDKLENLKGIESLKKIGNDLDIKENRKLKTLDGLSSLSFVGSDIDIGRNDSLESIDALDYVQIGSYLSINNNPFLSFCSVDGICEFINLNSSGRYRFYNNAPGCNSDEEVDSICGLSNVYAGYVLPDYEKYGDKPIWNILVHKEHEYPYYGITHHYYYDDEIDICYRDFSVLRFPNSSRKVYVRSDYQKAWYRYTEDCDDKEYLLYDFTLTYGEKVWVGWEDENLEKDTAQFVVREISMVEYFGVKRKQIVLDYAENDDLYSGKLTWVDGIGCLEHPFYPFAKMSDHEMRENELLCFHINANQFYQNTNYQTCDTSYTSVNDLSIQDFTMSPNPFQNHFRLDVGSVKVLDIKLYTITGIALLSQWTQNAQSTFIQVLDQQYSGICLVQIVTKNGFINTKLLRIRDFTY